MHHFGKFSAFTSFIFIASLIYLVVVKASGDYGPHTCLEGWVWREAFLGDYVCVPGPTRDQNAPDNAVAASRTGLNGTCLPGFVWREASPTDHICVTPERRTQTAFDNSQAANRVASLNIWITHLFPDEFGRFQINGDHFNFKPVTVGIYRVSDNVAQWETTLTPGFTEGFIAGSFGASTNIIDCMGFPSSPYNSYARAYDTNSNRYSAKIYLQTSCNPM